MANGIMVRTVVAACLVGMVGSAIGDNEIRSNGGVTNGGTFGRHRLSAAPTGAFIIYASADDNYGGFVPVQATGNYATGRTSATPRALSTGPEFTADAIAVLSWGYQPGPIGSAYWYWDSTGSDAEIWITGTPPTTPPIETARAVAISNDPNTVTEFWGVGETDTLTFTTTFRAGLSLDTANRATASASIGGDAFCDAFGAGPLWVYDWSAGQGGTGFNIFSDPRLGLDDAAIRSQFNAAIVSSGSAMVLGADVTISVTMNIAADANGMVSITSGGGTRYVVDDSGLMPTPGTMALIGMGGLLTTRRRTR
ncbi:MAG: hypothetical protein AABZ53_13605 [Planctomycetota bacterium]